MPTKKDVAAAETKAEAEAQDRAKAKVGSEADADAAEAKSKADEVKAAETEAHDNDNDVDGGKAKAGQAKASDGQAGEPDGKAQPEDAAASTEATRGADNGKAEGEAKAKADNNVKAKGAGGKASEAAPRRSSRRRSSASSSSRGKSFRRLSQCDGDGGVPGEGGKDHDGDGPDSPPPAKRFRPKRPRRQTSQSLPLFQGASPDELSPKDGPDAAKDDGPQASSSAKAGDGPTQQELDQQRLLDRGLDAGARRGEFVTPAFYHAKFCLPRKKQRARIARLARMRLALMEGNAMWIGGDTKVENASNTFENMNNMGKTNKDKANNMNVGNMPMSSMGNNDVGNMANMGMGGNVNGMQGGNVNNMPNEMLMAMMANTVGPTPGSKSSNKSHRSWAAGLPSPWIPGSKGGSSGDGKRNKGRNRPLPAGFPSMPFEGGDDGGGGGDGGGRGDGGGGRGGGRRGSAGNRAMRQMLDQSGDKEISPGSGGGDAGGGSGGGTGGGGLGKSQVVVTGKPLRDSGFGGGDGGGRGGGASNRRRSSAAWSFSGLDDMSLGDASIGGGLGISPAPFKDVMDVEGFFAKFGAGGSGGGGGGGGMSPLDAGGAPAKGNLRDMIMGNNMGGKGAGNNMGGKGANNMMGGK
ncbi:hypothetical protein ACHAWF_014762, partial [Thalassiosira exigua]